MNETTNFPLCWPASWKRTAPQQRKTAYFNHKAVKQTLNVSTQKYEFSGLETSKLTVTLAICRVLDEVKKLGVMERGDIIISTNLKTRLDGLPYSNLSEPSDPGVALYWRLPNDKQAKCMAVDRYTRVADNLAAIAATIYAMRAIERHGGAEILERAFLGFQALPPPMIGGRPWQDVLGVDANCSLDAAEFSYRIRAKSCHPDQGGDADKMAELNDAIRQARESL